MAPADCTPESPPQDAFVRARLAMVADQIASRGVKDARVLEAMRAVPRHEFVPASVRDDAYVDSPLPIGHGQTISQPYIVALMTELARPSPGDRVLEVGTGSGYQAAVLSRLVDKVFSVELVEPLARSAAASLGRLGYGNVVVRNGDGYLGWPDEAPFDIIMVTAAPEEVPPALVAQLARGRPVDRAGRAGLGRAGPAADREGRRGEDNHAQHHSRAVCSPRKEAGRNSSSQ